MDARPIGVFDSGVGGLTVFHALESAVPHEALVYLGDTARVPYGGKSAETVIRYSTEAAQFLKRHEVKLLVVACNTASSVALDAVATHAGVPVLGVILPGARRAAEQTRGGRIGVIGTRATIGSEAYPRAIRALRPDAHVLSRPCPLFVPLAEEGWTDNDVARQVAEAYLAPFRKDEVDTLVLGCTHYPLLRDVIGEAMGRDVRLVDSAESVAADVVAWLAAHPELAASPSLATSPSRAAGAGAGRARADRFFVTDVPTPFAAVAERFLGRPIEHLERARIEGE